MYDNSCFILHSTHMDNAALDAWKKDAEWQSDEEVAYHEAGHAVVAHALGDRIEDITIESIEYGDGVQRGLTRHWREGTPLKKLEDELQTSQADRSGVRRVRRTLVRRRETRIEAPGARGCAGHPGLPLACGKSIGSRT